MLPATLPSLHNKMWPHNVASACVITFHTQLLLEASEDPMVNCGFAKRD